MDQESEKERIEDKLRAKSWSEIKSNDSWALFKILGEFTQGFENLSRIGPCVSIFGSARATPESYYYKTAEEIAYKLAKLGFGVITGGGPGIMEAANKGAYDAKWISVGLGIDLPFESGNNKYVDPDKALRFDYFFVRKVMLIKYAQGFIFMPGGYGTLDEFFESMTLIQTHKIGRFPIVLVGVKFWSGLLDWLKNQPLQEAYLSEDDFKLFRLVDTADEAVSHIKAFYSKYDIKLNFQI